MSDNALEHQLAKFHDRSGRGQDARDPASGNDGDPVAGLTKLFQLRRDHDDSDPFFPIEFFERVQHKSFCADINTPGRFGDKKDSGLQGKSLGQADLLLVAAGELPRILF